MPHFVPYIRYALDIAPENIASTPHHVVFLGVIKHNLVYSLGPMSKGTLVMLPMHACTKLRQHRITIVAMTLFFALGGLLYSLWSPPLYRYSATILINPFTQDIKTDLASEMAIITSSSIIHDTLKKMDVPVDLRIGHPPYIEKMLPLEDHAALHTSLDIRWLDINKRLYGTPFTLIANGRGALKLTKSAATDIDISAKAEHVPEGTVFTITPLAPGEAIHRIQQRLTAMPATPGATNVMTVSFEHESADYAYRFLDHLIASYIAQSQKRQSAPIRKSLAALEMAVVSDKRLLFNKEQQLQRLYALHNTNEITQHLNQLVDEKHELDLRLTALTSIINRNPSPFDLDATNEKLRSEHSTMHKQSERLEQRIEFLSFQHAQLTAMARDLEQVRERFNENMRLINQHNVRSSQMLGFANVIDEPGGSPEEGGLPINRIVIISGLTGYLLSVWFALTYRNVKSVKKKKSLKKEPKIDTHDEKVFI